MELKFDRVGVSGVFKAGKTRFVPSLRSFSVSLAFIFAASGASAATLNVSGGQLLGASGVDVGGTLYNVEFLDGTCIDLYSGCDAVSDFTFQTESAALLASQALLDQVFVDGVGSFDSDPVLTNGCTDLAVCVSWTPYAIVDTGIVNMAAAVNQASSGSSDSTSTAFFGDGSDIFGLNGAFVLAVWTPVPEPGTAVLMGLGLIALSVRNRREV